MLEARLELCRALRAVTAQEGPIAKDRRSAARAGRGDFGNARLGWTQGQDGADDLGDHVAGLMDDDGVTDAHILAGKLVVVVQGRTRDDRAVDGGGIELRHGREHTGAPHLHGDAGWSSSPRAGT